MQDLNQFIRILYYFARIILILQNINTQARQNITNENPLQPYLNVL